MKKLMLIALLGLAACGGGGGSATNDVFVCENDGECYRVDGDGNRIDSDDDNDTDNSTNG